MARRLRLLGKKRGDRRTGSGRMGSYGEVLFFCSFLLIGAIAFYLLLTGSILPEWFANRNYVAHQCVVLEKKLGKGPGPGNELYRPEILVQYEVDGESFSSLTYDINFHAYSRTKVEAQAILDRFDIGQSYTCWYNPDDPHSVVLERGYSWWRWLLLIVPSSFVVIGAVGAGHAILQSGTSTERRAALSGRAARLDLFENEAQPGEDYPHVPSTISATDSPGTRLAYRLPVDAAPGWKLAGIVVVCLLWNGIVAWFLILNIRDHLAGRGEWAMTALVVPLAGAGLGILYFCIRSLVATTGAGATRLEISSHPLFPGEKYDVFLSQSGRLKINALEVTLVCEEVATYHQGTDTRTEVTGVYRQRVYRRNGLEMDPGAPFEDACQIEVPADAMHSFSSGHNEVKWKLIVTGDITNWPDYERQFPVIVYPAVRRSSHP